MIGKTIGNLLKEGMEESNVMEDNLEFTERKKKMERMNDREKEHFKKVFGNVKKKNNMKPIGITICVLFFSFFFFFLFFLFSFLIPYFFFYVHYYVIFSYFFYMTSALHFIFLYIFFSIN